MATKNQGSITYDKPRGEGLVSSSLITEGGGEKGNMELRPEHVSEGGDSITNFLEGRIHIASFCFKEEKGNRKTLPSDTEIIGRIS